MSPLRFGANYTPSDGWFHAWQDLDERSVDRDMRAIAGLGLDHVRIFPLWPILQPNRTHISARALRDVRRVAQIAGEHGLDSYVDVLQGHLSSFDFVPAWLTSWHRGNMFTDPDAVAAQAALVAALHETLAEVPTYRGITLGNELNQFSGAPHPDPMPATPADVDGWLASLLAPVPDDAGVLRLHAAYDAVWYLDDHPFVPAHASRVGDLTAIHSWVFNGTAQEYGPMAPQSVRHAEYLVELSRAFATDLRRPVWLQEVGAPGNVLDVADMADFCERAVRHAADSPALWGVTWWCSHDVGSSLSDFPFFEHTLGLIDESGRPKDIGLRFAEVAAELRERPAAAPRTDAVVVDVDDQDVPVLRASLAPGGSVFEAWADLAATGGRPALVTSRTAQDPADLGRRGVTSTKHVVPGARRVYTSVSDESFEAGQSDARQSEAGRAGS